MPSEFFKNSSWKIRWKLSFNRKSKQVAYYLRKDFFLTSLTVYAVQLAMPHATVLNIDDVTLIGRTNRQPYAIQRIGQ